MLRVGEDFNGFKVIRSEDTPISHIFVFEKRGKHIQLEMKTNDYISFVLDEYERQDIADAMVKQLYAEYGERPGHLDGIWGGM